MSIVERDRGVVCPSPASPARAVGVACSTSLASARLALPVHRFACVVYDVVQRRAARRSGGYRRDALDAYIA